MARKTTKLAKVAINRWNEQRHHFIEVLRVKNMVAVENQAPHIRDNSVDYWMGRIEQAIASVEDILFDHNCYHGFHYVDDTGNRLGVGGDAGFVEWLREYNTVE